MVAGLVSVILFLTFVLWLLFILLGVFEGWTFFKNQRKCLKNICHSFGPFH